MFVQFESPQLKVSVVVPFLNEQRRLRSCIESLSNQHFDCGEYELIFVDNGSTDDSARIVSEHQNITLLYEHRRDPYLARNRGIEAARGEFVAFTDADCIVHPEWLQALFRAQESSAADIVLGRLVYPAPTPSLLQCYEEYYDAKMEYLLSHGLRQCYYGHCGNMAVRRSLFEEVGLFSGMPIVGDTEILHRSMERRRDLVITYASTAFVEHSEVTSFVRCLHKLYECGQYSETYSRYSSYRPLRLSEKLAIYRHCAHNRGYGARKSLLSWSALLSGWISFEMGRFSRRRNAAAVGTL